mmetsp:Transcript_88214/g.222640  ORF Transcript_88214/g.222640 Transcript_88214/m.222640 type:complete len:203 (+) Transcript_88214:427-1035(+)
MGLGILVDFAHDDLLLGLGCRHATDATTAGVATREAQGLDAEAQALHAALAVIELDNHGVRCGCNNSCHDVSHSIPQGGCAFFYIVHHVCNLLLDVLHQISRLVLPISHGLGNAARTCLLGAGVLADDILHLLLDVCPGVLADNILHLLLDICRGVLYRVPSVLHLVLDGLFDPQLLLLRVFHLRFELLLLLACADAAHRFG